MREGGQDAVAPGPTPAGRIEAVRVASERMPEATPAEIAATVEAKFGLVMKPAIVAVILGTLRGQALFAECRQKALELAERTKAEEAGSGSKKGGKRRKAKPGGGPDGGAGGQPARLPRSGEGEPSPPC